ncbi:MAG: lipopolysaccharide biosynthesis protein [Gemmatimonadetes bacterium]|nr:lipopolysaccharide biosynthesis protein [Gemmatimonadota bacterium]
MTHPGLQGASPERFTPDISGPPWSDAESARSYMGALRKHWKLLLVLPTTLAVIALGLSMSRDRTYMARAAFLASEPSSMSGSLGALSSVASQLGMPGLSAVASSSAGLSTQFYGDLLTSNALLHEAVTARYEASAVSDYGGKPFSGTLVKYMNGTGKTAVDSEVDAMKRFAGGVLAVSIDRTTGIVRFQVRTKNRQLSALVARKLLDLVNDFNLRRRQTQAGAEREFTALRSRAALDSLRGAESALADFRATNIDFSRSPRLATRESELQRRVALAQQIYTTVAQRYELANIEAVRNTPVVTVLDAPEGLVEALPRHTAAIVVGAFALGILVASVIALRRESALKTS